MRNCEIAIIILSLLYLSLTQLLRATEFWLSPPTSTGALVRNSVIAESDREVVRELARDGVVIDRVDVVARLKNGAAIRYRCRHLKGITFGELLDAAVDET